MSVTNSIRVRPLSKQEHLNTTRACIKRKANAIELKNPQNPSSRSQYFPDQIYGVGQTTKEGQNQGSSYDIYENQCRPLIDNLFQGHNSSLIVSGAYKSGRNSLLYGFDQEQGILLSGVTDLITMIKKHASTTKFGIYLSMFEIVGDQVHDLSLPFSPQRQNLQVQSNNHEFYVDVRKVNANNENEIVTFIHRGYENQTTVATQLHQQPTNAHTIIQLQLQLIQSIDGVTIWKQPYLNLVNLANSSSYEQNINNNYKSVSELCSYLQAIKDKSIPIPTPTYALTKILQTFLGGQALNKTALICAISPSESAYTQTKMTLDMFKSIMSVCQQDQNCQYDSISKNVKELRSKVIQIKQDQSNSSFLLALNKFKEFNEYKIIVTDKLILGSDQEGCGLVKGIEVLGYHVQLRIQQGTTYIIPCSIDAGYRTRLNGIQLTQSCALQHYDTITIGIDKFFIFLPFNCSSIKLEVSISDKISNNNEVNETNNQTIIEPQYQFKIMKFFKMIPDESGALAIATATYYAKFQAYSISE